MTDTVAVQVSDALSTLLRGAVRQAAQRVSGALQSLTDPLMTRRTSCSPSSAPQSARGPLARIVRRAFGPLRSVANFRFPNAVVTSLAAMVRTEVNAALAVARTVVQTFMRGRVEG